MAIHKENIKLTFGLKVKQLRLDQRLSLSELAHKSGISISYLNEIEKGKKYPQTEKIMRLAEALQVSYDWLVSLKLHRKLAPLADVLKSNLLQDLPLEVFGVEPAQLLHLLSNAPTKLSAFISTLIEISRNYDMSVEQFYFSVLRSYQELHDNYFEELEEEVQRFRQTFQAPEEITAVWLTQQLEETYQYTIRANSFVPALANLRSALIDKELLINEHLNEIQKRFVLARELGYQFMQLQERAYTFSWVEINSFEEVLNNFKASYFASALLMDKEAFKADLTTFLSFDTWQPIFLNQLLVKYQVTPEMLLHRMTNLLPKFFQLPQLFFLRFSHQAGRFALTKEMHLAGLHNPHGSALGEHYCRRWVSLTLLQELEEAIEKQHYEAPLVDAQISNYYDSANEYLVFSIARPMTPTPSLSNSVSIGILLTQEVKERIGF
ncbi:MAG: helix-turn-helix domain-containing protein [Thermonemataceae bacterium]